MLKPNNLKYSEQIWRHLVYVVIFAQWSNYYQYSHFNIISELDTIIADLFNKINCYLASHAEVS